MTLRTIFRVLLISFATFGFSGPKGLTKEPLRIVSDIDDTVKLSNSGSFFRQLYYGIFEEKAFSGMRMLYEALLGEAEYSQRLYFVTNAPTFLEPLKLKFLGNFNFPKKHLSLRNYFEYSSPLKYKSETISQIMSEHEGNYILFGDNTEKDPEAYETVKLQFNHRVTEIYIHEVTSREIPNGQKSYLTAYDIAIDEYLKNRLTQVQVKRIGEEILKDSTREEIQPAYAYCPPRFREPYHFGVSRFSQKFLKKYESLREIESKIHEKIYHHCKTD